MQYSDRIYGSFDITSPVLIELIESPSMQRLKKIDQSGYSAPFYPNTFHSRFEHSMGVLYLLQRYNAPLEEQIAGLLHDVSHSAFSHTIDFLIGSEEKQNYQDDIFKEFIHRTEIPAILQKHQIPIDYILHEKNFPLQETPLPSLCADRIDYSLRSAIMFREITLTDIELILNKLQVHDQKWVFANKEIAFFYAYLFSFLNNTYYSSLTSAIMFQTTKDFLHYSLEKKYIVFQDLYTSDEEVLNTILPH
ncbi:MAG: HD domain-containing protein [Chlamydiota bacterium]